MQILEVTLIETQMRATRLESSLLHTSPPSLPDRAPELQSALKSLETGTRRPNSTLLSMIRLQL